MVVFENQLKEVFGRFGQTREALLPCLKVTQERFGCVPREIIGFLSEQLDVAPLDIYGAISFYGMLTTRHTGKYVVRVCASLPCHVNGAPSLLGAVREELGIAPGQTTADGLFTLEAVGCLGLCDKAPAMLVNDVVHGPLTIAQARAILIELKQAEAA